jgi:hypothetical protein
MDDLIVPMMNSEVSDMMLLHNGPSQQEEIAKMGEAS